MKPLFKPKKELSQTQKDLMKTHSKHHTKKHMDEMKKQMLRLENVKSKTGLSRSTIYRLMDEGRFPHQINLGYRAVAWLESEVDNWLDEKISSSRS